MEDKCMTEKEIDAALREFHLKITRCAYKVIDLLDAVLIQFENTNYKEGYKLFQEASKTLTLELIETKLKEVRHDSIRD